MEMDINKLREASFRGVTNPMIYDNENWLPITVDKILPWYWISDTGKIYSTQINALLKYDYVGKGYLKVTLQTTEGPKDYLVHRLVLLTFDPIPNPDDLTANHKDGDHENNFRYNLEWATYTEQMIHASENNLLNPSGFSESEVRRVCEELEKDPNQDSIILRLYGDIKRTNKPYYIQIKHLVNRIQTKQSWGNISCEYNILPKENINPNQVLSTEQVEELCKILEKYGSSIKTRDAFNMIGIDIGSPTGKDYTRYMAAMVNIRNKKCFPEITSKYNF